MFRRLLAPACALSIVLYFGWFASSGLRAGFTGDDLMNIYGGWREPVWTYLCDLVLFFRPSPSYRPLGSLFYRLLFEDYGFHALPFRIACYALLLVNLWLAWVLLRRLAGSGQVAALAVLIFAYHGQFRSLYVNTGMCYDLLCAFFYLAAFIWYLRAREHRFPLRWTDLAVWSALYILCLNAKEMAVSLPVIIGIYELLAHPPEWRRPRSLAAWVFREGRVALTGGVLTAAFIVGRVTAPGGLTDIGPYRPVITVGAYLAHLLHYFRLAFYDAGWLTPAVGSAIGLLMLAVTVRARSLPLRMAFAWMLVAILPIAFIDLRVLDAAYIPALGLALWIATAITALARRVRLRPAAAFLGVLLVLAGLHSRYGRFDVEIFNVQARRFELVYDQLRRRPHPFPKNSRILFLHDPIPDDRWASAFLVYLASRDRSLHIDRADSLEPGPRPLDFDVVLSSASGVLLECESAPFRHLTAAEAAARAATAGCRLGIKAALE